MRIRFMILVTVAMLVLQCVSYADEADAILGQWVTEEGKSRVEITKSGGKYYGNILWLKEPNYPEGDEEAGKTKHDRNNPDKSKQTKPIIGLQVMKGFKHTGGKTWAKGTIYDPENGKTYKCKATLEGTKKLNVRGYIGISLIGRTTVWTRYEKPKEDKKKEESGQDKPKSENS